MAEKLFVPLESLQDSPTTQDLVLSSGWAYHDFASQGRALAEALHARIGIRASDSASHVWELDIDGSPFHLCLNSKGQALLEPRTPAARQALPRLRSKLLAWAMETQDSVPGRLVPRLPQTTQAEPQGPQGLAARRCDFVWRRGVLGFGAGTGIAWLVALLIADSELNAWVRVAFAFVVFPAVGFVFAQWIWKQGRA